MKKKSISILGCGWLGMPLAKLLYENGWEVKGSTTSTEKMLELEKQGIIPFITDINKEDKFNTTFFQSEYLLVNIPPSKLEDYITAMSLLCENIQRSPVDKVLFISSTSAYPNTNKIIEESSTNSLSNTSNKTIQIERIFQALNKKVSIIRFAGLVGPQRHPGRFFSTGKTLTSPSIPVNIIHLDDCIDLIEHILKNEIWNETINGCSPSHPSKEMFYSRASQKLGCELKINTDTKASTQYKIISSNKSLQLGFKYKYNDLLDMLDTEGAF